MENWQLQDNISSMLALTHAIQNRLLQSATKGDMSAGVAQEITSHAAMLAEHAKRIGAK
jgi:hypothetical protein